MTNNNEILVRDITNPQEQLISYGGKQQVGFYDGEKAGEPALYIYIKNNGDRFTTVRRRAGDRKVKNGFGDTTPVPETTLYARAYERYLQIKGQGGQVDPEKAAMAARIAELEAKASAEVKKVEVKAVETVVEVKEVAEVIEETAVEVVEVKADKTARELKAELDALGVEYKGNASKEALLELLAK